MVKRSTDPRGYDYDETTDFWSIYCSPFPCGPWVTFPEYSEGHIYTKSKELNINGPSRDLIVQLWKGFCPRFADTHTLDSVFNVTKNTSGFPGMIKQALDKSPHIDLSRYNALGFGDDFPGGYGAEVGIYYKYPDASDQIMWQPFVEDGITIKFVLINPKNGDTLVHVDNFETWWRTKWMTTESYRDDYINNHDFSANPLEYELYYDINRKKGVWKTNRWPCGEITFDG